VSTTSREEDMGRGTDVYRNLANRLDAIPNGFPATESGVELRLLAKMFTPEEAVLGSVMRLAQETPAEIANRAGLDPGAARPVLKRMARKGLIHARKGERDLTFALMPFIVGIYEAQLEQMDAEFAALFEQYFREARGIVAGTGPSVHRVIPVERTIPVGIEVFPYERASRLVHEAKAWAVRNCICRVQQHMVGKGCDKPVENCVMLAPVEGAFAASEVSRPIAREEALRILDEAAEAGLVHSTGNFQDHHYYICNCCTCCCGVLRSVVEFDDPLGVARADFHAVVDETLCVGCGSCLARCQFAALSLDAGLCRVNPRRCLGCGLCVTECTESALELQRRAAVDASPPPVSRKDWLTRRAQERGISLTELL
jgi:electron transport complex protein RnfB